LNQKQTQFRQQQAIETLEIRAKNLNQECFCLYQRYVELVSEFQKPNTLTDSKNIYLKIIDIKNQKCQQTQQLRQIRWWIYRIKSGEDPMLVLLIRNGD
jgi:hypothetical protein